jgi:hypothetical protein
VAEEAKGNCNNGNVLAKLEQSPLQPILEVYVNTSSKRSKESKGIYRAETSWKVSKVDANSQELYSARNTATCKKFQSMPRNALKAIHNVRTPIIRRPKGARATKVNA